MSQLFCPINVVASSKSGERLTRSEEASRQVRQSQSPFVRKTSRTMLDRTFRGQVFVTVTALFFFTTHHQHGISGVRLVAAVSRQLCRSYDCPTAEADSGAGLGSPIMVTSTYPGNELVDCTTGDDPGALSPWCTQELCCTGADQSVSTTDCGDFCGALKDSSDKVMGVATHIYYNPHRCTAFSLAHGDWCSMKKCQCECNIGGGYRLDPEKVAYTSLRDLRSDCKHTCADEPAGFCTDKKYLPKDGLAAISCNGAACTADECCKPTCTATDTTAPSKGSYSCGSLATPKVLSSDAAGNLIACREEADATACPADTDACCMEQTCAKYTFDDASTSFAAFGGTCGSSAIGDASLLSKASPETIPCPSGCTEVECCDGPTVCRDVTCTTKDFVVPNGRLNKQCAVSIHEGTFVEDCQGTCCTSTTCASESANEQFSCNNKGPDGTDLILREDAASIGCDDGGCTRALCCRGAYCGACPHGVEGACTSDLIGLPNCQSCDNGYHRVVTPGHGGSYSCQPNVCLCSYGTPDTGTDCVTDSVTSCKLGSCYDGYNMVINANNRRECVPNELCKDGFAAESEVQCPAGTSVVMGTAATLLRCSAAACTSADDAATCCVSDWSSSCAAAAGKEEITCPAVNGAARVIDFFAKCDGATCTPSECCVNAPLCATLTCPAAKPLNRGPNVSCALATGCEVPECCVVASEPFRSVTTLSMDLPADADYTEAELLDTLGPSVKTGLEQSIRAVAPAGSVVQVEIISITFENSRRRTQLEDPHLERRAVEGAIAAGTTENYRGTTKSPTERQYTRDNKRRRASASTTRSDVLVDFTVKGGQAESGEDLPVEELVTSLPAADLEAAIADAIEANSATLPEGVSVADVVSAPAPQSETSTPVSGNAPTTTRTTDTNDDEDEETIVLVFVLVGAVLLVMFLFSMAVWRQKKHEEATRRYMQAYNRDGSWGTQSGNKMWKGGKQYGGQRAAWDQGKRGYNKNERWHYGAGGSSPSSGGKWGAASKGKNKWAGGTSPATPPPVRPKSPAPGLLGQGNKGSSSWSPHPQGMPGKGGLLASWIY